MNIKEMSLADLKVIAYDQLREAQRIQNNIRILETEIASREKAPAAQACGSGTGVTPEAPAADTKE